MSWKSILHQPYNFSQKNGNFSGIKSVFILSFLQSFQYVGWGVAGKKQYSLDRLLNKLFALLKMMPEPARLWGPVRKRMVPFWQFPLTMTCIDG
jgi:hypothetical protein